jgi:hypothetical protein
MLTERRERGRKEKHISEKDTENRKTQRTLPTRELAYRKRKKYVDAVEKAQKYTEP